MALSREATVNQAPAPFNPLSGREEEEEEEDLK